MRHRIIKTAISAFVIFASTMTLQAKDDNDHTLTALWKTYYTAQRNDRPKEEAAALEKIKKEALAKGLAWDYYDACREYVNTRSRSNWKEYEKAQEEFRKEIEKNSPPVARYFHKLSTGEDDGVPWLQFIRDNKTRMLKEHNPEFYPRDNSITDRKFSRPLLNLLSNDYEYALISLFADKRRNDSQISMEAKSFFSGRYPFNAFLDYMDTADDKKKDAFLTKYDGKAATLLVLEDRLLQRFNKLREDKSVRQEEYRLLNAACESFIKTRDSFGGNEKEIAKCCTLPDQIIKALNSRKTGLMIENGECRLLLRNVSDATVSIRKEDSKSAEIFNTKVKNPNPSFYVTDTVKVDLSPIPDGDYIIYCLASGVDGEPAYYKKHTLSMAWRQDSSGIGVYVSDYKSGEPVPKVDLTLRDHSGKTLAESKGLSLDGFTNIPSNISAHLQDSRRGYTLQASFKDSKGIERSSFTRSIFRRDNSVGTPEEEATNCMLITDRTAFTPEETVHFKAILYKGSRKFRTYSSGMTVKATLHDTKGDEISSLNLKTDDFGSVDGSFLLPRTDNNGQYSISVSLDGGKKEIKRVHFRVDDYVLPTFTLTWEDNDMQYNPGDTVRVKGNIKSYSGHNTAAADITYSVREYGQAMASGPLIIDAGGNFTIEFATDADSQWQSYHIEVKAVEASGETQEFNTSIHIGNGRKSKEPADHYFKEIEDDPIAVKVVAGKRTTWAVAELFTTGNRLLEKQLVRFEPKKDANAETIIRYDYKESYPDVVSLNIIYFQDGESYGYTLTSRRPDDSWKLPLSFTRFLDTTAPGAKYEFSIKTESGVQCAAAIFDKSTETVQGNRWLNVVPALIPAPNVYISSFSGSDRCDLLICDDWIGANYGYATKGGRMMMKARAADTMMLNEITMAAPAPDADMAVDDDVVEEEASSFQGRKDGYIRENFANTIAWEPSLRADKDGNISFRFTNADKLSTYYVQLFAHDRNMRNAVLRREMKVTLPVKIAVVEPQILYDGDRYLMRATLSNSTAADVAGSVAIDFLSGKDYKAAASIDSGVEKVIVPANGSATVEREIKVRAVKDLGIKLVFTPDNKTQCADAIFVSVPVLPTVQTITETHSSLLFAGGDRDAVIGRLRNQFVNFPGSDASVREISILDMLKEAIPERVEPNGDNAVALTEALYAGMLADGLNGKPTTVSPDSGLLANILKLQTPEGGFAWFEGMEASPLVTCLVLDRFHRMGLAQGTSAAVRYLDDVYFRKKEQPYWRGWISREQYLYIRSLYAGEEFNSKDIDAKIWKAFRKAAKSYLVPGKVRGLNGAVFAKARRVETLRNLTASEDGLRIASKWGIRLATGTRLENSLAKDIESLAQYAEKHKSGGLYFPNAVIPFRGLLESEAYAHSHLCRLMLETGHADIADGVRLWLMVQKETQKWDSDPGYLEALHAVFEGSDEMLATKVIALKSSATVPLGQVKAAGNGFTIERQYFKDGKQITDGEVLKVGDKITAVYKVWNEENRSFVKLTAPRCAALKPVDQRSGYSSGFYRNVLKDRTEFWYQSYPEEKTEVREEFYVQQEGSFQSAALEIVCEYSDHYRANDMGRPAMDISR